MFRIKANLLFLALSITALCIGALLFFRNPSNWLTLITGAMLWFMGCATMIVWCTTATFREEEKKTENRVPLFQPLAAGRTVLHIGAGHSGQFVSNWLVPMIVVLSLVAFVFGAAALLLKS
jgi:hypothetical protein